MLLATALLWSFAGVLIKSIAWNPLAIAGARSLIAAPLIALAARIGGRFRWSRGHLWGGLAYSAAIISFVVATKLTTAANAIMLQYTAPIYVGWLSAAVAREAVRPRDWAAVGIALFGVALFFLDDLSLEGRWGNALALFSGFAFGLMTLLMRRQKDRHPVGSVLAGNLITGAVCLPFTLGSRPPAEDWPLLVVMGVFQLGLAYVLFAAALRRVTAIQAITIPMAEPVLNPLWTLIFVGERPGPWALPGGAIVVGAVLWRALAAARADPTPAPLKVE